MKTNKLKVLIYAILIVTLCVVELKFIYDISYIKDYNDGNKLYKDGDFQKAIELYSKALEKIIPTKKECDVRVNEALAYCKTVQIDTKTAKNEEIQKAIETYETAINVLTQKNCDQHNDEAKQLKKDIEEEINKLKKNSETTEDEKDEKKEEKEEQKNEKRETKDVEEKIKEIKENATKDKREEEKKQEGFEQDSYNFGTKNW